MILILPNGSGLAGEGQEVLESPVEQASLMEPI